MPLIKAIEARKILNSHAQFTQEFIVTFDDGSTGIGASPAGETVSIYEDKKVTITPGKIIEQLKGDGLLGRQLDQQSFDDYLVGHIRELGRNNAYSLSLAFFNASNVNASIFELFNQQPGELEAPRICCNILNGGWHAYTNPVLSDFSEYMLVAKSNDTERVIEQHHAIQKVVRERLLKQPTTVVSGNPVFRFASPDNRACIEFLLAVQDHLGLRNDFDLMIDASAGDLWSDRHYSLAVTDQSKRTSDQFCEYWQKIIKDYGLRFLEDPFAEQDPDSWKQITGSQDSCFIIGDNFYSSDAERIGKGAASKSTHGVIIKPNQAGTITGIRRAVETAQHYRQIPITSHRSISTEETFLSTLTCVYRIPYIKIGPLFTDYSSVIRLNAILRLIKQGAHAH